jgi:hypothetical protein
MRFWTTWFANPITTTRTRLAIAAAIAAALVSSAGADADAAKKVDAKDRSPTKVDSPAKPEKQGVLLNDSRAFPGYNLINPSGKKAYLYDNDGRVVHTWTSDYSGGTSAYLLENGHLFRPAEAPNRTKSFKGPAAGGRIQEFDWDGNLVWDFEYHSEKRQPHHDAIKLPNGNALLICWEMIDEKEAVANGRRPETVKDSHLQPDCLVEIKPTGKTTGEVVWEWRTWDHLIQDRDRARPNHGNVSDHAELIDVNYVQDEGNPVSPAPAAATKDSRQKLNALGYVDSAPAPRSSPKKGTGADGAKGKSRDGTKTIRDPRPRRDPDWMHVNAVAYNADLDQIALSSPHFSEIWIIDHSTTREEARGHTGGRWGKGGDLLYRWGNPRAYRNGTKLEQRLFYQHNIHWIPKGLPGEAHLLVFNNGPSRVPVEHSSVDEFVPPTDKDGNYTRGKRGPFGPANALWSYSAPNKKDFYSWFISGAQRLPNGNTLINAGALGVVFEVTPEGETVWKFVNPMKNVEPGPPGGGPPKGFQAVGSGARDALGMKDDQSKQLDAIDKELNAKLEKTLSAEQIKVLAGPLDPAALSRTPVGEYLSVFKRDELKLSDAQKQALQAFQREFDPRIAKILTDDQKRQVEDFKKSAAAAGPGGPPRRGNILFRATRYALNDPAFHGRSLKPGKTLVEVQQDLDKAKSSKETISAKSRTAAASR